MRRSHQVTGPQHTLEETASNVDDNVTGFDWRGDTVYLQTHKDAPTLQGDPDQPGTARHRERKNHRRAERRTSFSRSQVASDALYVRGLDGGLGTVSDACPSPATANVGAPVSDRTAVRRRRLTARDGSARCRNDLRPDRVDTHAALLSQQCGAGGDEDSASSRTSPFDASGPIRRKKCRAPSADGTLVPLSLVYRKGLKLDASHPTVSARLRRLCDRLLSRLLNGPLRLARTQRRFCRLPRARRRLVRGGLASRRDAGNEGKHDRRLHRVRPLARRASLYQPAASRRGRNERRRHHDRRRRSHSTELFAAALDVVGVKRRAAQRIFSERTTEYPGVRNSDHRSRLSRPLLRSTHTCTSGTASRIRR